MPSKYPRWQQHYYWMRSRAKTQNIFCDLTLKQIKTLWDRDEGWKLKKSSIDRIVPGRGYTLKNCRFIERDLNSYLGAIGMKRTAKQLEAGIRNTKRWHKKFKMTCVKCPNRKYIVCWKGTINKQRHVKRRCTKCKHEWLVANTMKEFQDYKGMIYNRSLHRWERVDNLG